LCRYEHIINIYQLAFATKYRCFDGVTYASPHLWK